MIKESFPLISTINLLVGLGIGLATLWYSSTQWQESILKVGFEVHQLAKDSHKLQEDFTHFSKEFSKSIAMQEKLLAILEVKIEKIERQCCSEIEVSK